jgi:hypothetical protein
MTTAARTQASTRTRAATEPGNNNEVRSSTLARRPELTEALLAMESSWPPYINPDPLLVHWAFDRYPEHQIAVLNSSDEVIARAVGVPLSWDGDPGTLPDTGWDQALRQCLTDTHTGRELDTLCALEVSVSPTHRARDLSGTALREFTAHARRSGYRDVVVPVRPSRKHERPTMPMEEYARLTRKDGLPADPWLRVHVRAGGQVLKVCPASMTISAGLDQWREWTGLPFDTDGPVEVPGALAPVTVSVTNGHAVYVEPNVWVRHPLTHTP